MKIIDNILIINYKIYILLDKKEDKSLLDIYLNNYIESSRILLSDNGVDDILEDIKKAK